MALCDAACYYRAKGETLWDQMNNIYEKYGYYKETQVSIVLEGAEGAEKIQEMMSNMRNTSIEEIGKYKVLEFKDIDRDYVKNMVTGEESKSGLPSKIRRIKKCNGCNCKIIEKGIKENISL